MDRGSRGRWGSGAWLYLALGFFTAFFCWLLVFVCGGYGVFGGQVDWFNQHSVIPDYFRQQFYETGELFPEFAANLGGGQNLYVLSYYGLYSPLILPSYFFPFIKMTDYMMAVQFLCLLASVWILYGWLVGKGFAREVGFGTALVFLLSGPMIFQSSNQIMFVNYMPFLCLAFWQSDIYFASEGKKGGWRLAFCIFLMIMSSFYFSIGGMVALVLYGLHRYFQVQAEKGNRITFGKFVRDGSAFALLFLTAILMAGILLLPTAFVLSGRESGKKTDLAKLLIPKIRLLHIFHSPFGIGLPTAFLAVVFAGLAYKKLCDRILIYSSLLILSLPLFTWLLNGGIYMRGKALIPFLPLFCYLIADYIRKLQKKELSFWPAVAGYVAVGVVICLQSGQKRMKHLYWKLMLAETAALLGGFLLWWALEKYRRSNGMGTGGKFVAVLFVPMLSALLLFNMVYQQKSGRGLSKRFYGQVTDRQIGRQIKELLKKEEGFYRTEQHGFTEENSANMNRIWDMGQYATSLYSSAYQEGYRAFRTKTFDVEQPMRNKMMQGVSQNPIYNRFMGVKYILSKEPVAGLKLLCSGETADVYTDEQAAPIAYVTDRLIPQEEYGRLKFPYSQVALLQWAAVSGRQTQDGARRDEYGKLRATLKKQILPAMLSIPQKEGEEGTVKKTGDGYHVSLKKGMFLHVPVQIPSQDETSGGQNEKGGRGRQTKKESAKKLLFIRFGVKRDKAKGSKDVSVQINGVKNKLSKKYAYYNANRIFSYALWMEGGKNEVGIWFGKGEYEIKNVKCYVGTEDFEKEVWEDAPKKLYQSPLVLDRARTKGNRIAGKVKAAKKGCLVTSIPYEDNFEIRIDGREAPCELVNGSFLGSAVDAGEHEVEILYHAPGVKAGKLLSFLGFCLLFFLYWRERRRNFQSRVF